MNAIHISRCSVGERKSINNVPHFVFELWWIRLNNVTVHKQCYSNLYYLWRNEICILVQINLSRSHFNVTVKLSWLLWHCLNCTINAMPHVYTLHLNRLLDTAVRIRKLYSLKCDLILSDYGLLIHRPIFWTLFAVLIFHLKRCFGDQPLVKNLVRIDQQNNSETPEKGQSQVSEMSFNIKTRPVDNI